LALQEKGILDIAAPMTELTEYREPDAGILAERLANRIARLLDDAITARGQALIAVSGGKSPAAMFGALCHAVIDWSRVTVAQVDERWVEPHHADSNSGLIRDHLLRGAAAAARFVPMKNDAADARAGQAACEEALRALPPPFDVVLLGMGEDGHTASLFPHAAELKEGLRTDALCLAITPPAAPHQRLSLSLKGLLESRLLVLQIGGPAKETVYRAAFGEGPVEDMPVRAVLRQDKVPVEVWIGA
jgi:6-phosphogluconolactonase